mmetsp:Transcript_18015/g.40346  ORF Transcript_18015/g.40346 Transcript_18015/m.40346 type:complete len:129 (-) Transcript_18015:210-596(-)
MLTTLAVTALSWSAPLPAGRTGMRSSGSASMSEAVLSRRAAMGLGLMGAATQFASPAYASRSKLVPKQSKEATDAAREYRTSAEAGEGMDLATYQQMQIRKAKNKEKEYDEQQKKIAEQIALAAKGSK